MPAEPALRGRTRQRAEAGSIAILALWGVALISILLAAATFTTRTEVRIAENAIGGSRARLAAEAGTQLGLMRLLRRRTEAVRGFDGTAESWQDGSIRVDISIIDEAGKVDLNNAPLELFAGLFIGLGRPRETALLLACNILDRRGTSAPICPEPADGAPRGRQLFAVPEELGQLPGFDDALYGAVADYVTTATGASAIDPRVASRPVLLAIPGATAELVDAYLENRARWRDLVSADNNLNLMAAAPFVVTSPLRDFTINAVATIASSACFPADLQIRLTERPKTPYEILAMRAPSVDRGRRDSPPTRRAP